MAKVVEASNLRQDSSPLQLPQQVEEGAGRQGGQLGDLAHCQTIPRPVDELKNLGRGRRETEKSSI